MTDHDRFRGIFCITLLFMSSPSNADHPAVAYGSDASGPINTIAATAMPAGKWAIGLRNETVERDAFSDARLAGFADQGLEGVHSIEQINSTSATLVYGLTEAVSLTVRVPGVARDDIREGELADGEAEAHGHGDASGLGDLVFLASHRAVHANDFDASVQIGFKAPSGETHASDRGERLETEFQPGSGSWDFLVGAAVSRVLGRWSLHGSVLFNLTTEGSQDTEIGDALFYNVAAVYALSETEHHDHGEHVGAHPHLRWNAMIEINGETRWKNAIGGASEPHSGGTVVYLSPGLRVAYRRVGAFVSVGYPLVDETKGVQTDVDFRLVGGVSFMF